MSVGVMPITTIVIVLIGVLLNNNNLNARFADLNGRMGDLGSQLNRLIDDTRDLLRAEIAKSHSELLGKFAELDTRLSRIESHLNLH